MTKYPAYPTYLLYSAASSLGYSLAFAYNLVYWTSAADLSPIQLVLVGTVLEASIFIFEVPTGIVADIYSRRLSIIVGVFLVGIGLMLGGAVPDFTVILLAQVVWGIGYTFTSGASQAWISDEIGESAAGNAFLRAGQSGQVAGLAGMGLSILLARWQINASILAGGSVFLLLGLLLIMIMPETGFQPAPRESRSSWKTMLSTFNSGVSVIRLRPALLTILGIGLFYGLYSEGYDRLWVKLIMDNFTLPVINGLEPTAWFPLIGVVSILLNTAAIEIVRRKTEPSNPASVGRVLFGSTLLLVFSLFIFARSGSFVIAVAAVLAISTARHVIDPLYTTWVNQRIDSRVRATVFSMSSQVDAIGQITSGPFLGWIGSAISVRAAITASGIILSPILLFYARALRRSPEPSILGEGAENN